MNFNEYQAWAKTTDVFNDKENLKINDPEYITKVLGLAGEAGEVTEKFKKVIRDKNGVITDADRDEIVKELGDVLWYVATLSRYLGVKFEDVAKKNIDKLSARLASNKLHGTGDNR